MDILNTDYRNSKTCKRWKIESSETIVRQKQEYTDYINMCKNLDTLLPEHINILMKISDICTFQQLIDIKFRLYHMLIQKLQDGSCDEHFDYLIEDVNEGYSEDHPMYPFDTKDKILDEYKEHFYVSTNRINFLKQFQNIDPDEISQFVCIFLESQIMSDKGFIPNHVITKTIEIDSIKVTICMYYVLRSVFKGYMNNDLSDFDRYNVNYDKAPNDYYWSCRNTILHFSTTNTNFESNNNPEFDNVEFDIINIEIKKSIRKILQQKHLEVKNKQKHFNSSQFFVFGSNSYASYLAKEFCEQMNWKTKFCILLYTRDLINTSILSEKILLTNFNNDEENSISNNIDECIYLIDSIQSM